MPPCKASGAPTPVLLGPYQALLITFTPGGSAGRYCQPVRITLAPIT